MSKKKAQFFKGAGTGVFGAEYQAVLTAGITNGYTLPTESQQITQNALIENLKGYGLWDGIDVMFYFKGSGDSDFKGINWKNPTSNITTESASGGALTYSTTGLKGDDINYLDLGFTPTVDAVNYSQDDFGFVWEIVTQSVNDTSLLENTGTDGSITKVFAGGTWQYFHSASDSSRDIFNGGQVGVNVAELSIDTIYSSLDGGTVKVAGGKTPAIISDQPYRLLKNGGGGRGDCEVGFFVIGASLGGDQAKHLDFTNAVNGIEPPPPSADPNSPDFSWSVDSLNLVNGDWIPDVKLPSGAANSTGKSASLRTYVDVNGILQTQTTAGYRIDYSRGVNDPYLLMESGSTNYAYPSEPTATPSIGSDSNVSYESYAWANGLTTAVRVLDNTVERSLLYNFDTILWTSNLDAQKFICFVEMDDGSQPVIGTDFEVIMGGDNVIGGTVYEQQYGSTIWKVMGWTNNKAVGSPNDFGIKKLVTNSSKGFRVTGFHLSPNANSSVTKYTDPYVATTTAPLSVLRDEWEYVLGAGYTEGTLFLNLDLDANSGGNLNLVTNTGLNSYRVGVYWNTIRVTWSDPNNTPNNYNQVSTQKLTKVIITWDETGVYWYSDGVLKRHLDHEGLIPYEHLDKIDLYCSPYDGSDKVMWKKVQYWEKKMTEADALAYSII